MNTRGATAEIPSAMTTNDRTEIVPGSSARRFLVACIWILMLMTFSPPARSSRDAVDNLDSVGIAKLISRVLLFCALSYMAFRFWGTTRRQVALRLLLPWFAFAAWTVLSAAWSPLRNISLGQSGSFAVLLLLAFHLAQRQGADDIELFLKHVVWAMFVACLLLLGIYFALPDWGSLSRGGRGLMHATNGAATASIGCTLLLAARWLFNWNWSRSLLVPALPAFALTLILAQNRTAIGLTILSLLGLLACIAPFWRAAAMTAFGIGGALFLTIDLGIGISDELGDLLATYLTRGQTATQLANLSGRQEMWTVMWNSFLESPWIGHGYFVSSAKGEIRVWYTWTNWTAHNFWLQILVSTGTVGAILMAWALLTFVARLVRGWWHGYVEWTFGTLVGSLIFWQMGWGLNNESFVGPLQPESVVFFVILGLFTGRMVDVVLARPAQEQRSRRSRFATEYAGSGSQFPCAVS